MKEKGKDRRQGEGMFVPDQQTKGLFLDREEMWPTGKWKFIRENGENLVLGEVFSFNWAYYLGESKGALDFWT